MTFYLMSNGQRQMIDSERHAGFDVIAECEADSWKQARELLRDKADPCE